MRKRTHSLFEGIRSDFRNKLIDELGDEDGLQLYNDFMDQSIKQRLNNINPRYADMMFWLSADAEDLYDIVDDLKNTPSNTAIRNAEHDADREAAEEGSELIFEDDTWIVRRIDNIDAARYYGRNTRWCISGDNVYGDGHDAEYYLDYYQSKGVEVYFFINKATNHKYAFSAIDQGFVRYAEINDETNDLINSIPNMPRIPELSGYAIIEVEKIFENETYKAYRCLAPSFARGMIAIEGPDAVEYDPSRDLVALDNGNGRPIPMSPEQYAERRPDFAELIPVLRRYRGR